MSKPVIPSRYILQKAWKLGQQMALRDRRIRPELEGAVQYPHYPLFRSVHRHHIENMDAFRPWEAKLEALIDREARASRVDMHNSRLWEAFHDRVAQPIRAAFWYGWEQVHGLEGLYAQALERGKRRDSATHVVHVYRRPASADAPSALPEGEELVLWEAVARKIFEEMGADANEQFWEMPAADKVIRRDDGSAARTNE